MVNGDGAPPATKEPPRAERGNRMVGEVVELVQRAPCGTLAGSSAAQEDMT